MKNCKHENRDSDGNCEDCVDAELRRDFSGTLNSLVGKQKERQHLRECQSIGKLIEVLALLCAGDTDKITDLLTGYLWDEEEAGMIKGASNDSDHLRETENGE